MDYERLWERLIEALDAWTSASQTGAGEIEVAVAVDAIKGTLSELRPDERFAVYRQYALVPSAEPTLVEPRTPDLEPGDDGGPPVGPPRQGRWVALDRDGRLTGRFPDPPGPAQYTD